MRIDFLGLEAFLSIAQTGSFHGAAERLNLSQAALSHRMRRLEDDLGVRLFTRTTRRVALTPAGTELLPQVRAMLGQLTDTCDRLRSQGRAQQTTLTIGCLPTIATYYMPPILKQFTETHPDVSVYIRDNSVAQIARLVESSEAEFGITIVSAQRWDLDTQPLMREPYVLLCPQSHPLASKKKVSWAEFEGLPLIRISAQAANRAIIDDALGARREAMRWMYEVQHVATAASMVSTGIALTVVPRLAISASAVPGLRAVPIVNPSVSRTIGIVTKRGQPLSPAGETLHSLISSHLKKDGRGHPLIVR